MKYNTYGNSYNLESLNSKTALKWVKPASVTSFFIF